MTQQRQCGWYCNTDVCCRFIDVGGWDILNTWLEDSKETENTPVLIELLKVYQQLPITVSLLKKNSAAKTIKQLRKSEDESEYLGSLLWGRTFALPGQPIGYFKY